MPIKNKRTKRSRYRGTHTHSTGQKKRKRGKGHRGGVGMAGTGKRADHKKTRILLQEKAYFGKDGFFSHKKKLKIINVQDLEEKAGDKKELNLKNYKILSNGEIKKALVITASAASKAAIEKVKAAGGEIKIIQKQEKKVEKKPEDKKEKIENAL